MTDNTIEIFINLLEEGTPTIRPTQAEPMGNETYRILATPKYDPIDEIWEFTPGTIVKLKQIKDDQGNDLLLAVEK